MNTDGTQIAFSMSVEDKVEWPIKMPKKPEGAKWTETPMIVERLNYRRDRQGFTDTGYRHIFVVPASGGTPRRLTDGNFDHGAAPEWTPDGKSILFSGLRENDAEYRWRETEIYAIDVASGAVRQLIAPQGPGQQSGRVAGRKARRIRRLRLDERHVNRQQGLRDERGRVGSQPRSGDWDRSPQDIKWAADGSGLYFTAQNEGSQNLHFLPLSGGAVGRCSRSRKVCTS